MKRGVVSKRVFLTCLFHTGFAVFVHLIVIALSMESIPGGLTFELIVGAFLLLCFALWRHPNIRKGRVRGLSSLYKGVPPHLKTMYLCIALYVWGRFIVERHDLAGSVTDYGDLTHPVTISAWSILLSSVALAVVQSADAINEEQS